MCQLMFACCCFFILTNYQRRFCRWLKFERSKWCELTKIPEKLLRISLLFISEKRFYYISRTINLLFIKRMIIMQSTEINKPAQDQWNIYNQNVSIIFMKCDYTWNEIQIMQHAAHINRLMIKCILENIKIKCRNCLKLLKFICCGDFLLIPLIFDTFLSLFLFFFCHSISSQCSNAPCVLK